MADNENDSPAKRMAEEFVARDGDKALGIAREQQRRAEKLGDSAAADAWRRIARAIMLIELERLRRMLDETSGVTGSEKVVRRAVTTTKDVEWRRRGEPMSTSRKVPRITICGIPELGEHSAAGVTHVLSILDPNSPDPLEFAAFAPSWEFP